MAQKPNQKYQLDEFVGAVHADPAESPAVVMLSGYLGKSAEEGHFRVYPDASLSSWYEIPESDLIHAAPIEGSPLGGSHLWLKASAAVRRGAPRAPEPAEGGEGEAAKPQAVGAEAGSLFVPCGEGRVRVAAAVGYPRDLIERFAEFPMGAAVPAAGRPLHGGYPVGPNARYTTIQAAVDAAAAAIAASIAP